MHRTGTPSMRLFFALWPDEATRAALVRLQARLHGRLTRPENFHVTLAFLGRQPQDHLPALAQILHSLAAGNLSLELDRIGYFRRQRIAWAGMHAAPAALFALRHSLAQALQQHEISFDNSSPFRPHVTLARNAAAPEELPFEPVAWRSTRIALVESLTLPEGALYRSVLVSEVHD